MVGMDASELIEKMVAESGKSARGISREIGRSSTFVGTTIAKGSDIRLGTLAAIARAAGWKIVARKGEEEITIS